MKASEARQKAYVINMQETSNQYQAIMREIEIAIQKGKTDCMYFDPIKDEVLEELAKDGYTVEYSVDGRNMTDLKISWDDDPEQERIITKEHILNGIDDMCSNFFYYDRKNDEELSSDDIQKAYDNGVITIDDMVFRFTNNCIDTLNNRSDD